MTSDTNALDVCIDVSPDRKTVWVHSEKDGSTVGRFSKTFGMDVHHPVSEQLLGKPQCLSCTHEKPTREVWLEFCRLMKVHFNKDVPEDLLTFD